MEPLHPRPGRQVDLAYVARLLLLAEHADELRQHVADLAAEHDNRGPGFSADQQLATRLGNLRDSLRRRAAELLGDDDHSGSRAA